MAAIPTLSTERLTLRPWQPSDLDGYATMGSGADTVRYLGAGTVRSRAETAELIDGYIAEWSRCGHGRWAVELRGSREFVGYCGLLEWMEGTPEATGEVVYGFSRPHWGRGLASEAARAAVRWGFANFDWQKIVGLTHPDNIASQRVLAKLGMTFAGEWDGPHHRMKAFEVPRERFLVS